MMSLSSQAVEVSSPRLIIYAGTSPTDSFGWSEPYGRSRDVGICDVKISWLQGFIHRAFACYATVASWRRAPLSAAQPARVAWVAVLFVIFHWPLIRSSEWKSTQDLRIGSDVSDTLSKPSSTLATSPAWVTEIIRP